MSDISSMRTMQPRGREIFLRNFEEREERAQFVKSYMESRPQDTAEIGGPSKASDPAGSQNSLKDWTVLCYMDGHNDLEPYTAYSMLDLEAAGSNQKVNVVAELGRISQEKLKEISQGLGRPYEPTNVDGDWSGVRRYLVQKDDPCKPEQVRQINSPVVADLGEADMSDPKTLSDFLVWGIKNYPAKHYLVVLMDHGGGWRGAFTDDASAGGTHIMTTPQIAEAFKTAKKETGVTPDVVDMVACLMGSSETAYELKDNLKFYCASEEIATTDAFVYSPIINTLQKKAADREPFCPRDLAKYLVDYYSDKPTAFTTKSAMDLTALDGLKEAVDKLASALSSTDTKPEIITAAMNDAQNFSRNYYVEYYSHFRDLYDMAKKLATSDRITDPALKGAAEGVMQVVKESVIARLNNPYERIDVLDFSKSLDGKENIAIAKVSSGVMQSEGLSIYAPTDRKYTDNPANMARYGDLQFAKDMKWDEFLVAHNQQRE